jgi:hypothetical protein
MAFITERVVVYSESDHHPDRMTSRSEYYEFLLPAHVRPWNRIAFKQVDVIEEEEFSPPITRSVK